MHKRAEGRRQLASLDRYLFGFAITTVNNAVVILSGGHNKRENGGSGCNGWKTTAEVHAHDLRIDRWH